MNFSDGSDVLKNVLDIEILAPAGSQESLIPAVRLGADAVYLGAEKFSARSNAKNFSFSELAQVVEYCHVRGVKVYLTVNTLLKDSEFVDVLDLLKFACEIPVDALIIQDMGLLKIIKKVGPGMRLHASTQMSIHTPAGARALYELGFSRVVLARELSKNQIKEIAKASPIELEVFVHGALCMSVSGQCYLSAMIGGRSGNRGRCAQPCRLPFSISGKSNFDLSLKDLSLIDYIPELQKIGVSSVKIEGRMKRPEYVAVTTKACKLVKDGQKISDELRKQLKFVFSRSGFTDGYYTSNLGKNMFGIRSKDDVKEATGKVLSEIRQTYKDETQKIEIDFYIKVKRNENLILKVKDFDGNEFDVEDQVPQDSISFSLTKEMCVKQLQKTGGTPFLCRHIKCEIDQGLSVSISKLNLLRRQAIEGLENVRKKRLPKNFFNFPLQKLEEHKSKDVSVRARFPSTNVPSCFKKCELIYVPLFSDLSEIGRLVGEKFNVAIEIPRGLFLGEDRVVEQLKKVKSLGINDVWAANLGAVKLAKEQGFTIHGGFGLNVTNSFSIECFREFGVRDIETSFELTANEISGLKGTLKRGIISYGRLPLMLMRNCPIENEIGRCMRCKNIRCIRDRKGFEFPLVCQYGCTELLNSVQLDVRNEIQNFKNIDFTVLRFSVENYVENGENFLAFNSFDKLNVGCTRGLYSRGVD